MQAIKPYLKGKRHVIWDWNGTLLNDIELSVSTIGRLLVEHGLRPISVEDYRDKFCFPVVDYYRALGFLDRVPFETVGDQFIARYYERFHTCRLFDGTTELLKELHSLGMWQSILSAAKQEHLDQLTKHYGVKDYFKHIYGLTDHYAASKVERGKALIAETGIDVRSTIMIGDTDHDLAVGKALGIDVLLLGDGHQSSARLKAIHHNVISNRYQSE